MDTNVQLELKPDINPEKFIYKFIKFMANAAVDGSYAIREIVDNLGSISYKGARFKRSNYYNGIYNLKKRGLVITKKGVIRMTPKGQKWLKTSHLRYMQSIHPEWDKKWRIVIFDIPQEKYNARNLFRNKLKNIGFISLQKSVFVFPYPCENEISELCQCYKISDYVNIITADSLGFRQEEIKRYFGL